MSKEERKVPELRFKGFHDDWEQRELGEVVSVLDGDRGKNYPSSEDFNKTGHTLFLSAANVTKNGFSFTNNQYITEEKSDSLGNGKLTTNDIVITSRGSIGHIAWYNSKVAEKIPYARINSGMLILSIKSSIVANYIVQYMKSPKGIKGIHYLSFGSAQPQLTKKDIKNYKIPITIQAEQDKIGNFQSTIDKLITLHQRKIQILDNMYSLFIREIYPKKHEVVPKIRFSEYSSHWVKITLESLLNEFSIKSSIENEYQILSSTNSGMEFRKGRVSGSSNRGYKIIDNGDLVLSPQNLWLGNININKLGKGLVSPSYKTFSIDKVDGEFLEPQLRTKRMLNTFENVSTQGASVVRRNLDMDLFKQIIVKVPTNQEKEKIANLLNLIMNLIKHYDSKLMKLQTIKTEYLKKMFL